MNVTITVHPRDKGRPTLAHVGLFALVLPACISLFLFVAGLHESAHGSVLRF
jgi:hypothetical protein